MVDAEVPGGGQPVECGCGGAAAGGGCGGGGGVGEVGVWGVEVEGMMGGGILDVFLTLCGNFLFLFSSSGSIY